MRQKLKSIARVLGANLNPVERGVHFHAGPAGPYVCDHDGCVSPALDPADMADAA
jgi:hypothetical protein